MNYEVEQLGNRYYVSHQCPGIGIRIYIAYGIFECGFCKTSPPKHLMFQLRLLKNTE